MFFPISVCLLFSRITQKVMNRFAPLSRMIGQGSERSSLNLGMNLAERADPGFFLTLPLTLQVTGLVGGMCSTECHSSYTCKSHTSKIGVFNFSHSKCAFLSGHEFVFIFHTTYKKVLIYEKDLKQVVIFFCFSNTDLLFVVTHALDD